MVSCQKGPTRHAYAWQIGPFWQDILDIQVVMRAEYRLSFCKVKVWFMFCRGLYKALFDASQYTLTLVEEVNCVHVFSVGI